VNVDRILNHRVVRGGNEGLWNSDVWQEWQRPARSGDV